VAEIGITVPQQMIEDLVRAAIVRELGGQQALIEGIVTQALQAKKDSYRNSPTIFQEQVAKMIREVAEEAVRDWIEQQRERIKAAFVKHLQSRDGLAVKKMVDGLVDGVSRYSVAVKFNWKEE